MRINACRWMRSRLPLLAGDDLVGPERRLVERHLVHCPACRDQLAALRDALGALHAASAVEPIGPGPVALWPGLAREIRESRRPAPAPWPRRMAWPLAAATAASLLAVVGVVFAARLDSAPRLSMRPISLLSRVKPSIRPAAVRKAAPVRPSSQRKATAPRRGHDEAAYAIEIPKRSRPAANGLHRAGSSDLH